MKTHKKLFIPLFTAPESHRKSLFWTFLWPMGEKRGLGGKNVIEMTPLKLPKKYKKIIKSEKKIFFTITYLFLAFRKKVTKKSKVTKIFLNFTPISKDSKSQTLGTPYILRPHM